MGADVTYQGYTSWNLFPPTTSGAGFTYRKLSDAEIVLLYGEQRKPAVTLCSWCGSRYEELKCPNCGGADE